MHGDMTGWFEVRVDGPKPSGGRGRHHYRLFCLIDLDAKDVDRPLLVVVTGAALGRGLRRRASAGRGVPLA
jgi:hypothetical protein